MSKNIGESEPDFVVKYDETRPFNDQEYRVLKKAFIDSLNLDARELYEAWMSNSRNSSTKISSYFNAYAEQLAKYRNTKCTLVEIGVMEAGSLLTWKRWLGKDARVIGIDVNPNVKKFDGDGIEVIIGNQADPEFWKMLYEKIPEIDIVIDDGGHQFFQQIITFFAVLTMAKKRTALIFEDVATSFFENFFHGKNNNSFLDFTKQIIDNITLKQFFSRHKEKQWRKNFDLEIVKQYSKITGMSFYTGIVSVAIDPQENIIPLTLYNSREGKKLNDYRYAGDISGVDFVWPDAFNPKSIKITGLASGGKNIEGSVKQKEQKIIMIKGNWKNKGMII